MNKTFLAVALAVVLIAGLAFVGSNGLSGHATAGKRVSLGYVPGPYNALPIIALKKGFFAEEGLDVVENRASFAGPLMQELVAGRLDFVAIAETPVVFLALKGGRLKILARHQESVDAMRVVYRKDANISAIGGLGGRRVGVAKTSIAEYWLYENVARAGAEAPIVVDVAPQNMASALYRGEVDAVYVWDPFATIIEDGLRGAVGSFTPESDWFMILIKGEKTGGEESVRILRALKRAQTFLLENEDEAIRLVAEESSLDEGTLRKTWNPESYSVEEPAPAVAAMKRQAPWAASISGFNGELPDFGALVDTEPIRQLNG